MGKRKEKRILIVVFAMVIAMMLTMVPLAGFSVFAEEQTYTVTLNANGGYFMDDNGVQTDEKELVSEGFDSDSHTSGRRAIDMAETYGIQAPSDSDKHLMFDGWYKDPECTGTPVASSNYAGWYCPDKDVTVYAKWCDLEEANYFREIIFDPNGGSFYDDGSTEPRTKWIRNGSELYERVSFDEGYVDWYYDKTCTRIANQDISPYYYEQGTVLYAGATPRAEITLNANGGYYQSGSQRVDESTMFIRDGKPIKESPSFYDWRDPYNLDNDDNSLIFECWYWDKGCTRKVDANEVVPDGTTLYAGWINPVNVTLHTNRGQFVKGSDPFTKYDTLTVQMAPNRPIGIQGRDYYVVGENTSDGILEYYLDAEHTQRVDDSTFCPEEDMDLYYYYNDCVTLTMVLNGGYINTGEGIPSMCLSSDDHYNLISDHSARDRLGLGEFFTSLDDTYYAMIPSGDKSFDGWYFDKELTIPADLDGKDFYEDVTIYAKWVDERAPFKGTSFESSKGTSLKEKTSTTLTATATGGWEPYTYKFIVYNTETEQWYTIRDFSPSNTCVWNTGAAGKKILYVEVKDRAGHYRWIESLDVTVYDSSSMPLTVSSFDSSKGTTLIEKTQTTLTATAEGGKAPYTYKFIVYNNQTGEWYKIRDFASANTCDWYTGAAGSKTLYVDVKDSTGTTKRQELPVKVSESAPAPLTVTSFTSSKGTKLDAKTNTTLTAKATGGKAPYTYKFIVYNNQTGEWYRIRDFATSNTCDWYTGGDGTKTLYVDVKDGAGTVKRQELAVTVSSQLTAKLTSSKGTSLKAKDTTTLTAQAAGGSGSGYTYKFIVYNTETGQWFKIQDYSTKKTASWYTGTAGKKILYLDIKDSAGNYVRTPLNVTVK